MKGLVKKASLIPFGLVVGLLLSAVPVYGLRLVRPRSHEITAADHAAVRKMLDEDPRAIYQFDEDVSYRLKPNFVGARQGADGYRHQTNSLGLLGPEEISSAEGVQRVLFLGDSVTYGYQVPYEACFTTLIAARAGAGCQVMNAGCCGWSTHQELGYFSKYLSRIPWDLLVLVVCLNDSITYDWVWDPHGHLAMQDQWPLKGLRLLDNQLDHQLRTGVLRQKFNLDRRTAPLSAQENGLLAAWDETSWQEYLNHVIGPFIDSDHPRFAVVVIPTRQQLIAVKAGAASNVVFAPQAAMARFCEQRRVPFWNAASEVLLDAAVDEHKAFNDESHLSENGHSLIAGPLCEFVHSQLSASGGGAVNSPIASGAENNREARR